MLLIISFLNLFGSCKDNVIPNLAKTAQNQFFETQVYVAPKVVGREIMTSLLSHFTRSYVNIYEATRPDEDDKERQRGAEGVRATSASAHGLYLDQISDGEAASRSLLPCVAILAWKEEQTSNVWHEKGEK